MDISPNISSLPCAITYMGGKHIAVMVPTWGRGGQICQVPSPPTRPPTHPPANNWWQERRTPTQQLWLWESPPSPLIDPGRENQPPTSECLKLGKLSSACQANSPVAGLESNSVNRLCNANCPAKNLTPTKICYFDFTSTLGIPKITIPL